MLQYRISGPTCYCMLLWCTTWGQKNILGQRLINSHIRYIDINTVEGKLLFHFINGCKFKALYQGITWVCVNLCLCVVHYAYGHHYTWVTWLTFFSMSVSFRWIYGTCAVFSILLVLPLSAVAAGAATWCIVLQLAGSSSGGKVAIVSSCTVKHSYG